MALAGARRRPAVGLDIGSSIVRAVVLRRGPRRWTLLAAGEAPVADGQADAAAQEPGVVSAAVRAVLDRLNRPRAPVAAALRGHSAIVKRLSLPAMSSRELKAVVPVEAERHIPFEPKDVRVAFQAMGRATHSRPAIDVLLVAARRDRIEERAGLVTRTGRRLGVLDVEALALTNAYTMSYPDRLDPFAVLIHIGRSTAIVCLLARDQLVFTRDISSHAPPAQVAVEVRKTIDFCVATMPVERPGRLMLSGGAWQVMGDALGAEVGLPVEALDPFRRVSGSTRLIGADARPAYAIAVGLAMRREGDE